MAIVSLNSVSISFGGDPILDAVDFLLEPGDKACVVGRNGEGKSTLLRLIAGEVEADAGSIVLASGTTVAYLPQSVPQGLSGPVRDIVASGLASDDGGRGDAGHRRVEHVLSLVKLDGEALFEELSGGLKRRALLGRALATDPEVLLLDEPTNHLDIDSIEWLEGFLRRHNRTLLFVTHDRMFLRRLATRIVDLDRGRLSGWTCDYDTFLKRKQDLLNDETVRNARFDKKLTKEEAWIRQGIKARRTRDEGRVRALEQMREQRAARRAKSGTARVRLQDAATSGNLVVVAEDVAFAYGDEVVIEGLTSTIMRGDKVGIIGPNGCGKTTLLRLLLGPYAAGDQPEPDASPKSLDHRVFTFEVSGPKDDGLQPLTGTVRRGTRLEVAYFDQHRHELDESASVFENVGRGSDVVVIDGQSRNVYGYLQEFLFSPERARTPVSALSGGERNRLLLAKLFARPANLLVMDEPTNDLDAETLELLEEVLVKYRGTLLLVSHDREFLNNVVTSTLVFEGEGRVKEYVGGYDDWLRQRRRSAPPAAAPTRRPAAAPARPRRLNYRETRELESLPRVIETLETDLAERHAAMADPEFYRRPGDEIARAAAEIKERDEALAAAYARWDELEAIRVPVVPPREAV